MVERFRRRYILQIVTAELQTAHIAYFQRKIQLSGFSSYPDGSPSQLIRIIGVLLYTYWGGGDKRERERERESTYMVFYHYHLSPWSTQPRHNIEHSDIKLHGLDGRLYTVCRAMVKSMCDHPVHSYEAAKVRPPIRPWTSITANHRKSGKYKNTPL